MRAFTLPVLGFLALGAAGALSGCDRPAPPAVPEAKDAAPGAAAALGKELREKGEIVRSRPPGGPRVQVDDRVLEQQVAQRLAEDPDIPGFLIQVEVTGGQVALQGRVASLLQLEKAIEAALALPGVAGVRARLQVEPDEGGGPIKGEAEPPVPATR